MLWPTVRFSSIKTFFNLYLNCDEKMMEINKKRPVLSHIKDLFGGRGRDGLVVSVIAFLV